MTVRTYVRKEKIMMNQDIMDEDGGSCKRARPNPLEDANSIAKLARIYDKKVQETRTAKGLAPAASGK